MKPKNITDGLRNNEYSLASELEYRRPENYYLHEYQSPYLADMSTEEIVRRLRKIRFWRYLRKAAVICLKVSIVAALVIKFSLDVVLPQLQEILWII